MISEQDVLYITMERFCHTDIMMYTCKARLHYSTPPPSSFPLPHSSCQILTRHAVLAAVHSSSYLRGIAFKSASSTSLMPPPFLSPSPSSQPPHTFDLSIVALAKLPGPTSNPKYDRILGTSIFPLSHWDLLNLAGVGSFSLRQTLPVPIHVVQS
jgi:hypothetical protein